MGGRRWVDNQGMCLAGVFRELYFGGKELLASSLLHPISPIKPLQSLFSSLMGYTGLHTFVKAAAVKLTLHTLASGNALLVKLIHSYQVLWPKDLMEKNEQGCWTFSRTCDKPHTTSLFPEACMKTDA